MLIQFWGSVRCSTSNTVIIRPHRKRSTRKIWLTLYKERVHILKKKIETTVICRFFSYRNNTPIHTTNRKKRQSNPLWTPQWRFLSLLMRILSTSKAFPLVFLPHGLQIYQPQNRCPGLPRTVPLVLHYLIAIFSNKLWHTL